MFSVRKTSLETETHTCDPKLDHTGVVGPMLSISLFKPLTHPTFRSSFKSDFWKSSEKKTLGNLARLVVCQ